MALNQPTNAATQYGIANGSTEGYAAAADVATGVLPAGNADLLPATDATNGGAASDTQTVLDNLAAAIAAAQAADMDMIADAFASGDGTITNAGTGDDLQLSLAAVPAATVLAGSPAAVQVLVNAFAAAPVAVRAALAGALISTDADNTVRAGTDGLVYENDAT